MEKDDKLVIRLPGIQKLDSGLPDGDLNVDISGLFEVEEAESPAIE